MSNDTLTIPDNAVTSTAAQSPVTAVDIVLEPDATMILNAKVANAGLLRNFPDGFALGNEHAPHMSVMGGYINTADLDKLYTAAAKVLTSEKVTSWKLTAFKYYYMPLKQIGLGGILVQPTPDLVRLQEELIDATAAFMAPAGSGTAAAFATTPQDPDINQATLDAVATYLAGHTGEHYAPHVTIGVGTADYLNGLVTARFPKFTFFPAGAAIYQFGNFGTAAKCLRSFELTQ
jgi:hypothetical protein